MIYLPFLYHTLHIFLNFNLKSDEILCYLYNFRRIGNCTLFWKGRSGGLSLILLLGELSAFMRDLSRIRKFYRRIRVLYQLSCAIYRCYLPIKECSLPIWCGRLPFRAYSLPVWRVALPISDISLPIWYGALPFSDAPLSDWCSSILKEICQKCLLPWNEFFKLFDSMLFPF